MLAYRHVRFDFGSHPWVPGLQLPPTELRGALSAAKTIFLCSLVMGSEVSSNKDESLAVSVKLSSLRKDSLGCVVRLSLILVSLLFVFVSL